MARKKKKKTITKKLEDVTTLYLGEVDDIINSLCDLKEKYENKYNWIRVLEGEDCYSESPSYYLWGERFETEAEYERRIKKEKKVKDREKAKKAKIEEEEEKEQLRKLIKKYPEEIKKGSNKVNKKSPYELSGKSVIEKFRGK
jgi:hypothetical protein